MKLTTTHILAIIGIIGCAIILLTAVFLLEKNERNREKALYNNGICAECHGEMHQVSTWVDKADGTVFHTFKCDKCGKRINLHYFGTD
jgi:hypothetical protein